MTNGWKMLSELENHSDYLGHAGLALISPDLEDEDDRVNEGKNLHV